MQWHLFFDLDLTLFAEESSIEELSGQQVASLCRGKLYKNQSLCFFALHQHTKFLKFIQENPEKCKHYYLTMASYNRASTKEMLNHMFDVKRSAASYIHKGYLRPTFAEQATIELHTAARYFHSKTQYLMEFFVDNEIESTSRIILIDDSEHNRRSARFYGFQVINPTADDYVAILEQLQQAIAKNQPFHSPHNFELSLYSASLPIPDQDLWQQAYSD